MMKIHTIVKNKSCAWTVEEQIAAHNCLRRKSMEVKRSLLLPYATVWICSNTIVECDCQVNLFEIQNQKILLRIRQIRRGVEYAHIHAQTQN